MGAARGRQTIFPKHRSHLVTYYRRWSALCDKKTARSNCRATLQDVRQFLKENAAEVQFQFFRFSAPADGDDDDDLAVGVHEYEQHVSCTDDLIELVADDRVPPPAVVGVARAAGAVGSAGGGVGVLPMK